MAQDKSRTGDEDSREFAEETDSLWRITLAPLAWAVHFLLCYGLMAAICAKAPDSAAAVRVGLLAVSVAALALIGWIGLRSWRQ